MLRKGAKGGAVAGIKLSDRGDQTEHPFLDQILAVPSRKEERTRTGADHLQIAAA